MTGFLHHHAIWAALGLTVLFAGPAIAETVYATSTVNMRSGPGTEYEVVGQLKRAQAVDRTSCNADRTWCYVRLDAGNGWVSERFLSTTDPDAAPPPPQTSATGQQYVTTSAVNMRSGPGTRYAVVDSLEGNAAVTRGECSTDGNWCYVSRSDGANGWVFASYLRPAGTQSAPQQAPQGQGETFVAKTTVNVRSGPSTQYAVIGQLDAGDRVTRGDCNDSGTWCYVTHQGTGGWVANSLLQPLGETQPQRPTEPQAGPGNFPNTGQGQDRGQNPAGTPDQAQRNATTASAMPVRSAPTLFSATVGRLGQGETVTLDRCDTSGDWCHITKADVRGWVPAAFLRIARAPAEPRHHASARALTTAGIVMRKGPGRSYDVVGFVPAEERVEVKRCNYGGDWCEIDRNGRTGWIAAKFLRLPPDARQGQQDREPPSNTEGSAQTVCFTGFGGIKICVNGQ